MWRARGWKALLGPENPIIRKSFPEITIAARLLSSPFFPPPGATQAARRELVERESSSHADLR